MAVLHKMCNNPIYIIKNYAIGPNDITCNPDPFVFRFCGKYYCYSSGETGINVLVSDDLQSFEHMGYAYTGENEHSFWAPALFYYNGIFYLYYSSLLSGEKDDHSHYLRVASSRSPLGPFAFERTLISDFAIDPHVVQSRDGIFLLYSRNVTRGTDKIGTVISIDRMCSPICVAGNPRNVIMPTIEQEIFEKNRFGDGKDWYTIEGGFYIKRNAHQYVLYSGNAYTSPNYFVGCAISNEQVELTSALFKKDRKFTPVISSGNGLVGTGHNSIVKAPDNCTDLIVYHAVPDKVIAEPGDHRQICIDPIRFRDGAIETEAPSLSPQLDLFPTFSTHNQKAKPWKQQERANLKKRILYAEFPGMPGAVLDLWYKADAMPLQISINRKCVLNIYANGDYICISDNNNQVKYKQTCPFSSMALHHFYFVIRQDVIHYAIDEVIMDDFHFEGEAFIQEIEVAQSSSTTELASVELTLLETFAAGEGLI